MSQRRQLSTMDNIEVLTDHELRQALKEYSQAPGPITDSTRNLYRKKLASLMDQDVINQSSSSLTKQLFMQDGGVDDDDDDTSDEDYNGESEDDDDEEEDEEEDLEDEVNLTTLGTENETLTTSMIVGPDATPNRISRGILVSITSFFVAIAFIYLYWNNNFLQPYKPVTKQLLILLSLSPIGYAIYRTLRFYRMRRYEEMQRVCGLVNNALELLQSPENPKGLMPILHIRDTLLTAPERKSKKMTNIWNKAVKFIEEHESRVKVEIINIDGEDFRAWKWIGSRKL